MRCFGQCADALQQKSVDPTKHVCYTQGMVLGVDDFNQEFAYLTNRDQWLSRDLIGYGTVSGLAVAVENEATGPRVAVSAGVAVSPQGELIRVKARQCASLNDWLKKTAVKEQIPNGTFTLPIWVVLCYRDCPTDEVPILGEPCRTEEETTAPSRIADDFQLELRFSPPDQREEDGIRVFIAWLKQIEIAEFSATPDDLKQFVQTIEALIPQTPQETSPPATPLDFLFQSPPSELRIPASEVCEYLRAAFRLWVTRLRPFVQVEWSSDLGCECADCSEERPRNEKCLLLAELQLPLAQVGSDWVIDGTREVIQDESRRPWLLHLRLLQEWMLCGCDCGGKSSETTLAGDVTGPASATEVEGIRQIPVSITGLNDGQVLAYDATANQWSPVDLPDTPDVPEAATQVPRAENVFSVAGTSPALGTSLRYALEDHTHGLPPDPIPPHTANAHSHDNHLLAGDVTGTLNNTRVAGLQGVPISGNPLGSAQNGFVLKFNSSAREWQAARDETGAGTTYDATTGLLLFRQVAAGQVRSSDFIPHELPVSLVLIQLGIELDSPVVFSDDTDTFFPAFKIDTPAMVGEFTPARPDVFRVRIRDMRNTGEPRDWLVRWWALPITREVPQMEVGPNSEFPRDLVLNRLRFSTNTNGLTLTQVASDLNITQDEARTMLTQLKDEGLVRTSGNRFLPQ
jgi:hypothetical protein